MSILGTLGSAFGTVGGSIGIVLKVLAYVPQVVGMVEKIASIFKKTEVVMTGEQKKALAMEMVKEAFMIAEGITDQDIADEAAFSEAVGEAIEAVVKAMNALKR